MTSSKKWLLVDSVGQRPAVSFVTTSAKDLPGDSQVFLGGDGDLNSAFRLRGDTLLEGDDISLVLVAYFEWFNGGIVVLYVCT